MSIFKRILFICLICLITSPAWGKAHIGIWPIKVTLWPQQKIGEVHLNNKGVIDATLQISAKSWDMDESGKFIEADTGDFVFYPRLIAIPAGEEVTIRVGYNGDFPRLEKPYRLFIQELPEIQKPEDQEKNKVAAGFNALLRLSIPLFVSPAQIPPAPQPVIDSIEITETGLRVPLKNPGTHNFLIKGISADLLAKDNTVLANGKGKQLLRVLPQRRVFLDIPMDTGKCRIAQNIRLKLDIEDLKEPFEKILPVSACGSADKKE